MRLLPLVLIAWTCFADAPIPLSEAHQRAVNRRRRIAVQYDAADHRHVNLAPAEWLQYIFAYPDEPGSQIDSILWDIGMGDWAVYPSRVLQPTRDRQIVRWREQGFEWAPALIAACRKRNIEVFWNHRFSEVDIAPDGALEMHERHPVKAAHPDWIIRSWWWGGLWNLASPGLHDYKLAELREIAETLDVDGIRIDFARHMPVLPPGRQWELREHGTAFMRKVRLMLLDVERRRGRPVLLAAKVPETLEGCRIDGLDVETWAGENLVDLFTLGSRSMEVDMEAFRRITRGRNIKLQPCFDDHHTTDGYRFPPIEFFRGVFGNWWRQGADSVETFNWSAAPPDRARAAGGFAGPLSHRQAYHEIGSPETLRLKDKLFAVERRGGYPWSEGYFNRNDSAPLPAVLANDGRPSTFQIRVSDDPGPRLRRAALRLVLFRASTFDRLEVALNGTVLGPGALDPAWKDPQIFSPKPQPNSGGKGDYKVDPAQKLLLVTWQPAASLIHAGRNEVRLRVLDRAPFPPGHDIQVEKIEVNLDYAP